MPKLSRHNVQPRLALEIALLFTVMAGSFVCWYLARHGQLHIQQNIDAAQAFILILAVGVFSSCLLFLLVQLKAVAQVNADLADEQLLKSKEIQEQLNTQLETQRTKLKELISQMPGVVWEMRGSAESLKLTFISDYVEAMVGYSASEWMNTPGIWFTAIHPGDRQVVSHDIAEIFQSGAGRAKFRWIAKDSRDVWVEMHATVVRDEHRQIVGLRGVTMDITARHHAEERLRDKEARLQIALSAASLASWHWDVISGNLMWDDTSYTWTDFVRRVHPDDQGPVRNALDDALRDHRDIDFEFRIVHLDGAVRWLALKAKVFQGPDSRPAYITGVSIDITERRKTAGALRASEERYRLAARATNDAIWDWDLTTGLVQWNEGVRTLFGYTADVVGTDRAWRISQIHPGDRDRVVSSLDMVIERGGRFWSEEYQFRCANGSFAVVSDRAYIEHTESGKAARLIGAMTDVTRLRQAEREREQLLRLEHTARKQAELANRVKDEFIATLSHELRTPLTPIVGWTQLLKKQATNQTSLQRGLSVIEQNARAQAKLIEDLLDVSRIVTGKFQVKLQTSEIHPIVHSAIDAIQPTADVKGVSIDFDAHRSPIQLAADPDRLKQVFWNLLSNAVKFTPRGGRITISLDQVGSDVQVVVRDTGEGIDPEFLPHVFERFSQADSTTKRTHGGLGVGLAIVRYIVELHAGNVMVESDGRGRGATFSVTLPVQAAVTNRPRQAKRISRAVSNLRDLRLLVVEDQPHAKELLALVLEHEGATVATAASAEEAFEKLELNPPDILISDIAMPGEDGYALLKKIRELERQQGRSPVPAIALTAYAREEDLKRSVEAGFEMHLTKPIEFEKLISAIMTVATKRLGRAG